MKFGIITLVSDNYGNKYQNYAVEQLMSEFGNVITYGLENCNVESEISNVTKWQKLKPSYIREVLISRPMYKYDINRIDKGIIHNLAYVRINEKKLLQLREERSTQFKKFSDKNLHIATEKLNLGNVTGDWISQIDYFICGSDQIWNPFYATTSELAFCSFASDKTICVSPSFGVAEIPECRKAEYAEWLKNIYKMSVRETAGQKIIRDLTGREADVFLDPTMLIPVDKWNALCVKPQQELPDKYIVCYFLGRITKGYKENIDTFSRVTGLPVVMLFDIMTPQYYTLDPAEVLYTIKNSEYVLTDSFHGTVFSILFHKNFNVFERNEGNRSMNSRLQTLLGRFELKDREKSLISQSITKDKWEIIERILNQERERVTAYLKEAIKD